jgi:hypothetical protein
VPRNDGKNAAIELAVHDVEVGATDSACSDPKQHLMSRWPDDRALRDDQRRMAGRQHHGSIGEGEVIGHRLR